MRNSCFRPFKISKPVTLAAMLISIRCPHPTDLCELTESFGQLRKERHCIKMADVVGKDEAPTLMFLFDTILKTYEESVDSDEPTISDKIQVY